MKKGMILIAVVAVLIGAGGCASRTSLAELKAEAEETGDWSAVRAREQMDRKMGFHRPGAECPVGEALLCDKKGELEVCECVSSHTLRRR